MPKASGSSGNVRIHGLTELQAGLGDIVHDTDRNLKKSDQTVAAEEARAATSAANSIGGVAAHVAPSITATGGQLGFGGPAYPMAGGAEFGGAPNFPQFKQYRGNGEGAGYFLYPTIRRDEPKIERKYVSGLDDLLRRADLI